MRNTPIHEMLTDHYRTLEQAEAAYQQVIEDGMDRFYEGIRPSHVDAPWTERAAKREHARLVPLALAAFSEITDKAGWPQDR